MEWLIITLLAIGWYTVLSKRNKLVQAKKKQKRYLESVAQAQTKTYIPPEYIIWDITSDVCGDPNEL
jgi:hypothetical protein